MITVKLCIDPTGQACTSDNPGYEDALSSHCDLAWLDVARSDVTAIRALAERLHFHDLAVEDALKGGQRSKLDLYQDQMFLVVYGINIVDGRTQTRELSIFIGDGYVVTIHDGGISALDSVSDRWNAGALPDGEHSKGLLLYAILDGIVDDYFPVLDEIGEQLEIMESLIFESSDAEIRRKVFAMRRELLELRRIVSAERDVINQLLRHDLPMFSHQVSLYLADVYDHLLRSFDWIESYRDHLSMLLDLQSAAAANRLNQIMKTLTASSIILMSAGLVAGIYGMNFTNMPELNWVLGYPMALGLMVVIASVLYVQFRKRDWF
ncbi:MAG: magnesium/cobalt transporter CorA [Thermomicrobiales bacterium]